MEFNIGKKKIIVNKKTVVRGAVTLTASAGAYIIVRKIIKNNIPAESLTTVGKVAVAVGGFFLANHVGEKIGESAGEFFDECVSAFEGVNKATKEAFEEAREGFNTVNDVKESV